MWTDSTFRRRAFIFLSLLTIASSICLHPAIWAQESEQNTTGPSGAFADVESDATSDAATGGPATIPVQTIKGINIFTLFVSGGWFMLPILLMSLLVVIFTIERFIALRRDRVLPAELITELGQMGMDSGGFDPREAYRLCQKYPSAASSVIRSMLLKVGRPQSEVEHAVAEASEREAERIYANVRWLNMAAAVTPLIGLLGTVWGMIRAFHDTTNLAPGQNKADFLAGGIYVALVTTMSGLLVAIPAAIFAHYFEAKITSLFHETDELLFNLMPQIERYEGRVRFSQKQVDERSDSMAADGQQPAPATTAN